MGEKLKIIDIKEQIRKIMEEREEALQRGDDKFAEGLLNLAAHLEATRTKIEPIKVPFGCSII